MCWVSLLPLPGFSLGLNTGLWTPVKYKRTHKTHTYTGLLMGFRCLQPIRHMRRFLVCLWVAVGVGGVWVGDVFVFPAKLKARFFFLLDVFALGGCTLQM